MSDSQPGPSTRRLELDVMRVAAIAAVILLHVSEQCRNFVDIGTRGWLVFTAFDSVVRWAVPLFVMISGSLFLDPARPVPIKKLYGKYIKRILVAFAFWSLVYTLLAFFYTYLAEDVSPLGFVHYFLQGEFHLWYMWLIIGMYLMTPVLRRVAADRAVLKYLLVLMSLLGCLLPLFQQLPALEFTESITGDLNLQMLHGFTIYYLFGFFLSTTKLTSAWRKAIYALGLFALAVTFFGTWYLAVLTGEDFRSFLGMASPTTAAIAVAVFVFLQQRCAGWEPKPVLRRTILLFSELSFGIYLSHIVFVRWLQFSFGITTLSYPLLISVPLNWVIVITGSAIVTWLLKRIPVVRDYLV